MNDDATDAVMGLLNLSGNLLPSPMTIETSSQPTTPTIPSFQSKRNKYPGSVQGQQHHNRAQATQPSPQILSEAHDKFNTKVEQQTLTSTNRPATNTSSTQSQKRRSTSKVVVQYTPKDVLQPQTPTYQLDSPHYDQIQFPLKEPESRPTTVEVDDASTDAIRCICGFSHDDGLSIACDDCSRWCHAACFGISKDNVPENWSCWVCLPRSVSEGELRAHAVKIQHTKLAEAQQNALLARKEHDARERDRHANHGGKRRHGSPAIDRKRKASNNPAIDGASNSNKRKRRASILPTPSSAHPTPNPNQFNAMPHNENDDIEVVVDDSATPSSAHPNRHPSHDGQDQPPWQVGYTPITEDIVPDTETTRKLQKYANGWRGVSALEPWIPPEPPSKPPHNQRTSQSSTPQPFASSSKITLQEVPPHNPDLAEGIRPPAFTLHTTHPAPSSSYLFPYPSLITPSSVYLSDPLNGYAHMGIPKPFVHLIGPPLDVALDTRAVGNEGRWVRNGCRPNAVIRPMVCPRRKAKNGKVRKRRKLDGKENRGQRAHSEGEYERRDGNGKGVRWAAGDDSGIGDSEDDTTLSFGVFATKDINEGEEVVLGWEWDDGSAVHMLPAAVKTPGMFPPAHLAHLKAQMANILHGITSTFTTCACGRNAKDCALTQMERFVYDEDHYGPFTPGPTKLRHVPRRSGSNDGHEGDESELEEEGVSREGADMDVDLDFGPLLGRQRGFRTRVKSKGSGGIGGVEMCPPEDSRSGGQQRSRPINGDYFGSGSTQADRDQDGEETEDEVWVKGRPHTQTQLRPPDPSLRRTVDNGAKPRQATFERGDRSAHFVLGQDGAIREEEPTGLREVKEELIPPKMRKRWLHGQAETLKRDPALFKQQDVIISTTPEVVPEGDVEMQDMPSTPKRRADESQRPEEAMDTTMELPEKSPFSAAATSTPPPPPPPALPDRPSSLPAYQRSSLSFLAEAAAAASPSEPFSRLSLSSPAVPTWKPTSSLHKILNITDHDKLEGSEYLFTFSAPVSSNLSNPVPPDQSTQPTQPDPAADFVEQWEEGQQEDEHEMEVEETGSSPESPIISQPNDDDQPIESPRVLQASWSPLRKNEEMASVDPQEAEDTEPQLLQSGPPKDTSLDHLSTSVHSVDEAGQAASPAELYPDNTGNPSPALSESPGTDEEEASPAQKTGMDEEVASPAGETIAVRIRSPTPPPAREPTPPPPAPPKVKMSLKDFALRKKKQREGEKVGMSANTSVAGGSVEASPAIPLLSLAPDVPNSTETDSKRDPSPVSPTTPNGDAMSNTPVPAQTEVPSSTNGFEESIGTSPSSEQTVVETLPAISEPEKPDVQSEDLVQQDQKMADQQSLEAKKELVEAVLPPAPQEQQTDTTVKTNGVISLSPPVKPPTGAMSPSLSVHSTSSRNLSQEEGEILSPPREISPPTKPSGIRLPIRSSTYIPRSHTPPTQPRNFGSVAPSPQAPQTQTTRPPSSRPPPSGPRALRMSGGGYQPPSHADRGPSFAQRQRMGPPRSLQDRDEQDKDRRHPPRGPSADRDRERDYSDRDRDRDRDRSWNSRRSGWGR